jgi:heat shock protein HslJ
VNSSVSNNNSNSAMITPAKINTNLDGLFHTSLNANPNALIRINGTTISLENGCNSARASFNAYSDRSLIIGNFSSTKKFCPNDTDSVYLTALSKSIKYNSFVNNSLVILSDASGILTITLTL